MHTLFTDPSKMDRVDPIAPAVAVSGARQAASLTRTSSGKTMALVLRPCEIRAFVELVKLNQGALDHTVIIGVECLGRMENTAFLEESAKGDDVTARFLADPSLQNGVSRTCGSCDSFTPAGADITCVILGMADRGTGFEANTDKGKALLERLGFSPGDPPGGHDSAVAELKTRRSEARKRLFDDTASSLKSIDGFQTFIANCLNCYNCRTACPVCYCRECVFLTDVFAHPPEILLERALRRGAVKMPVDTTMFHLTRLSHIGHACVGCGQCSSACPSGIAVADMFRTVAEKTQEHFNYMPGRDAAEPIPLQVVRKMNHDG
jgi:formate dehydrogenase subunit beta